MFGKLFDNENWFWRWMGRIPDFFALSILWALCSLPVITVIPSSIALYDSIAHCIRFEEGGTYRRFFRTLWQELTRGIPLSLLWLAAGVGIYAGYNAIVAAAQTDTFMAVLSLIYLVSLFLPVGVLCWMIPLESRFVYDFATLWRNSLAFAFSYLPTTVIVTALAFGMITLCLNLPVLIPLAPAVLVTVQSFFIEKVLQQHMPKEEGDA